MFRLWHVLALIAVLLVVGGAPTAEAQDGRRLGAPGRTETSIDPAEEARRASDASEEASLDGSSLGSPWAPSASLLGEFHLEITLGTVFPLAVGGGVRLEHQSGLFFDAWAGGAPTGYANLWGEAAGAYSVEAGPRGLLVGVLDGAAVMRLGVGMRPIADLGLELSVGYSLLYGAPTLSRTTLEAATGQSLRPAGSQIGVMLAVHALHFELGYGLVLFDHLLVRATLGGALAVGADFRVGVPAEMRTPGGPVEDVERGIASSIPGRVFVPTARLEVGARF